MHVGQSMIPAAVAVGECFVIDTELMQDRGVDVVDIDFVGDN